MSDKQILALFEPGSYEVVPHDGMRRTIAQRLTASVQTVPHFYLTMDCDIGKLLAAREEINAAAPKDKEKKPLYKLSVNDFVIKAMAIALQRIPNCNVSWTEGGMLKHKHSDIGVAVAMPGGLITPIIRKAETKSLSTISAEMKDFAARARARKLKPEEYQGGTTAVSNLGMYGIKDFTAVINPPHATILAVGTSEERAVVRNGKIEAAHIMSVTLVLRSPRGRRRARRRTDRRVQDADRKSRDDDGVRLRRSSTTRAIMRLAGVFILAFVASAVAGMLAFAAVSFLPDWDDAAGRGLGEAFRALLIAGLCDPGHRPLWLRALAQRPRAASEARAL